MMQSSLDMKPFLSFPLDSSSPGGLFPNFNTVSLGCGRRVCSPAEARPHGLALQEDIWDADVDLHQKLLRRWRELKERSSHE